MKNTYKISALCILICLSSALVFAQSFEGIINLSAQNEERKEKASVAWFVSGGNHRLDFDTQTKEGNFKYSLIYKAGSAEVQILTPGTEKNLFYKVPLSGFPKSSLMPSGAIVTAGSGSKLISGIECKEYSLRSGDNSAVAWMGNIPGFNANDVPSFLQNNGILGAMKANNISGIPLEFVIYNNNNEILATQSIAGISKQIVDVNKFEIPAGYEAGN